MQDYKSLHPVVMTLDTLINTHTYIQLNFANDSLTEQSPAVHYNKNMERARIVK